MQQWQANKPVVTIMIPSSLKISHFLEVMFISFNPFNNPMMIINNSGYHLLSISSHGLNTVLFYKLYLILFIQRDIELVLHSIKMSEPRLRECKLQV